MRTSFPRKEGFPTRLQLLIELAGNFERLGAIVGLSRRTLSDWARNLHQPHPGQYVKLAEACGVDLHWLRTGEGEAPRKLNPIAVSLPGAPAAIASELAPPQDLLSDLAPPRSQVNEVAVLAVGQPTIQSISAEWADALGLGSGAVAVRSTDDSATPRIPLGEPVLGARVRDLKLALPFSPNAVWILEHDGSVIFRRVKIVGDMAVLASIGEKQHRPKEVPLDGLTVHGRAVWSGAHL